MEDSPPHVKQNTSAWDSWAADYIKAGHRNWAANEPTWGIFSVPESSLTMLPVNINGLDTIELGCGTAYVSSWLARRGAHPVGIDVSQQQLNTAKRFQHEFEVMFPLILGNAEQVPLPDASFDFAISEYGASIWCDPYAWIPEAARLLRPGGALTFLINSPLLTCCTPDSEVDAPATNHLIRPYVNLHRVEWSSDHSVEFHLPHGKLMRLLKNCGFIIDDLIEVEIPVNATTEYAFVSYEWARQWPCEEVWKVHKIP